MNQAEKPISYEELERAYREASEIGVCPDMFICTESSARRIFGDEVVDAMIQQGFMTRLGDLVSEQEGIK